MFRRIRFLGFYTEICRWLTTCAEFVNPPIWPSYKRTIGTLACGLASCTPLPAIGDGP
jgi:hypothetical protein